MSKIEQKLVYEDETFKIFYNSVSAVMTIFERKVDSFHTIYFQEVSHINRPKYDTSPSQTPGEGILYKLLAKGDSNVGSNTKNS